jgi:hypothetical protein
MYQGEVDGSFGRKINGLVHEDFFGCVAQHRGRQKRVAEVVVNLQSKREREREKEPARNTTGLELEREREPTQEDPKKATEATEKIL